MRFHAQFKTFFLLLAGGLIACSSHELATPVQRADVGAVLSLLPEPYLFRFSIRGRPLVDLTMWHNPYLVVYRDHLELFDRTNHTRRLSTLSGVVESLAHLPRSAWPEGRVVALSAEPDFETSADTVEKELNGAGVLAAVIPTW